MKIFNLLHSYLIPKPSSKSQSDGFTSQEPKSNSGNNTPISGVPSILDSLIRGLGRGYETTLDSSVYRLSFRFMTENFRYLSSRALLNYFQKEQIKWNVLVTGLSKAIEITGGSALSDPNREPNCLIRMKKGFYNQVARVGTRAGLVGLKMLNHKAMNSKYVLGQMGFVKLADEFLSRVIFRVFDVTSDYKAITIVTRTFSQFLINEWLRIMPLYKLSQLVLNPASRQNPNVNLSVGDIEINNSISVKNQT